jgi:hypothetical protein
MAQQDDGATRKSTTYKEFNGMNSQDARYGVGNDEFFYLENIMRVADGRLHSVPGPNTVATFTFPTNFLLLETSDADFLLLETGGFVELNF